MNDRTTTGGPSVWLCIFCDRPFATQALFDAHQKTAHPEQAKVAARMTNVTVTSKAIDVKDWGKHEGVVIFLRAASTSDQPDQTDQIVMAKRLGKNRPYCGCYSGPGGSVDEGETARVAAIRELQEETGLTIDVTRLIYLDRTGPHLCPPEQQGSGTPFYMTYFGLDLKEREEPKVTEPEKLGEWETRSWMSWILSAQLVRDEGLLLEKFHHTKRLA